MNWISLSFFPYDYDFINLFFTRLLMPVHLYNLFKIRRVSLFQWNQLNRILMNEQLAIN